MSWLMTFTDLGRARLITTRLSRREPGTQLHFTQNMREFIVASVRAIKKLKILEIHTIVDDFI
jgi:hypothetical protein